ncbi:hypothetical protein A3C37_01605 [Candidatus Peribacteria bacterium RIFCSPHIGHO2_02_FULL_53_20]|nr:MAG: hypothetical protein A3C37_01605 [Candidatus Peribacteria bacterium RIFCSPHIGHO2_02_FULL_53_20]OGJ75046.1 MAG: hypothetical protein A3G69_02085 [Candidatus Peribacteria bacterium RIFCSPLOWO2_12_FULL_53_10]HLC67247.1 hypothetical protein [Candidatus Nanoarchaeia archaeon]
MRTVTLLQPDVSVPLIRDFLGWYLQEPLQILRRALQYAKAFNAILSIPFLLRTLFKPWKNIVERGNGPMLAQIVQVLAMAIVSRGVGAVMRIGAIIIAIVLQVALLVFTIAYLVLWIAYPLVLLFVIAHVLFALIA